MCCRLNLFSFLQSVSYITDEILKTEAEEGYEKIQEALNVCKSYVDVYYNHKSRLKDFFKEKPVIEWDFQSSVVFGRFEQFRERLKIVQVKFYIHVHVQLYMYVL